MSKILLFSHSGFSDHDANGITMKNLLSAWEADEKAEFYCDVQPPDFTAAYTCFRVTDVEMLKAFCGKKVHPIFFAHPEERNNADPTDRNQQSVSGQKIPPCLKRMKYHFALKWLREFLWMISPWGHRKLTEWIELVSPDAILYMVGESLFMDRLVLRVSRKKNIPIILYNGEAYRIIDLRKRHGLERAYYFNAQKLYSQLADAASLIIYNSEMLKHGYEMKYGSGVPSVIAYNSAEMNYSRYCPNEKPRITYFGNMGVGRVASLLIAASVLVEIDASLFIDVYGNAADIDQEKLNAHSGIRFHGFVSPQKLHEIIDASDVLLHVESFDPAIVEKLKYAFSTKIAQCLCAGRCLLTFAPKDTASTQYLTASKSAAVAANPAELRDCLTELVKNKAIRLEYAARAYALGKRNHNMAVVSQQIKSQVGVILQNEPYRSSAGKRN